MSNSWGLAQDIRKLAEEMHSEAYELERAADILDQLRERREERRESIAALKERAKQWVS